MKELFLPCVSRGWFQTGTPRPLVRLEDGGVFYPNPAGTSGLLPGTPLTCLVLNRHADGTFDGELLEAHRLPEVAPGEERPLALIDAANSSSDGPDPSLWTTGAAKLFAACFALDRACYRPVCVADPGFLLACQGHAPSSAAVNLIRGAFSRRWKWLCRAFDGRSDQHADVALLRLAEEHPDAVLITGDAYREHVAAFPWLATPSGRRRIHRISVRDVDSEPSRIELVSLGVSEAIALPLFAAMTKEAVA